MGTGSNNSELLANFDFFVPDELVAQHPLPERDQSRMMVVDRKTGSIQHRKFRDLLEYLSPKDLVVFNKTKVFRSRLLGERIGTGGKVEVFLLKQVNATIFHCLLKSTASKKVGLEVRFSNGLKGRVLSETETPMVYAVEFAETDQLFSKLESIGKIPLPPYMRREAVDSDQERYQTVYANEVGSVAAPTAGLHFTNDYLEEMKRKKIPVRDVVLHVGIGTFLPIKVEKITDHKMHEEEFRVDPKLVEEISETKAMGGRVVAVGTTTVRTLESMARGIQNKTNLFLRPGEEFLSVDVMFTNFHQPKSSLIVMVAAFMKNDELWREAYRKAVEEKYRFFSYGDCMLIL